ncbi:nuclear transport factor 2 family protein [Streptomyces sp. SBC-4]|nr:nuclear transport factor 2 family protein [Streptomyces sp. SBC-4]MDV5145186.1 nuclear transport factor 2 family protein [Streptomyces sp. SBC-4]
MTIPVSHLTDPAVRAFVTALNANDQAALTMAMTPDVTMSDDGSERDVHEWLDREVFGSRGHMDVESEADDGRVLVATYRNDTWGEMRTKWQFTVDGGKISRFETGQA